jgi:RNA polymerase primary sigma factor
MNNHRQQSYASASYEEEIHYYLQDLAMIPVLSLKAEQELVQQLATDGSSKKAEAARTRLVEANLRLVVRIARRYQPFGIALADLIQEGNLALLKAMGQFDPQRSTHFRAFATRRVCWTLYRIVEEHLRERHILESDRVSIHPLSPQVLKALAHNAIDEQALVFELPQERFISLTVLLEEADADLGLEDERLSLPTYCCNAHTVSAPEEFFIAQERGIWIAACLRTLTMKERLVLIHRYLLDISQTLEEVGRVLGVTRERVRQLEVRGIQKMRHPRLSKTLRSLL